MTVAVLIAVCAAVAFAVTVVATPVVRRIALSNSWTDRPDGVRKLHAEATPSAGGLAIFAGVGAATLVAAIALPLVVGLPLGLSPLVVVSGLVVVALGAFDDVYGLDFKVKLAVEVLVAYALLHADLRVDLSSLPFFGDDVYLDALYSIPLTIFWVVGVMNAVNLIDGVDGLASGVVAIAFGSLAVAYGLAGNLALVVIAVVFVGALCGFLVYNFNPASIFMGDSGSLFLGYALAVYTLSGPTQGDALLAPVLPLLALGLPLLDTSLSVVRRLVSRRAIMAPDHDHIHHRMSRLMPPRKAVVTLYAVSAFFGLTGVLADTATGAGVLISLGCAGALGAGLLIRLGYVRMPYSTPRLRPYPIPPASDSDLDAAPPPADGHDAAGRRAGDPDGELFDANRPRTSISS